MAQQQPATVQRVPSPETLGLLARMSTKPIRMFGPDRRNEESRQRLVGRVRAEFLEMRGLTLTLPQARRLFGLRDDICRRVLAALICDGVLRQRSDGCYNLIDFS